MICPVCGHENIQGLDTCENCGHDLRTSDIPHPGEELEALLVRDHLAAVDPRAPVSVPAGTSVAEAIRTMQEQAAEAILVTEDDRLVGIFTERDALLKVAGSPIDGRFVRDVMTPDPVVLRDRDSIAVAIHKMAVGGFRHIPLVDARGVRATGIVSSSDLFRHILHALE